MLQLDWLSYRTQGCLRNSWDWEVKKLTVVMISRLQQLKLVEKTNRWARAQNCKFKMTIQSVRFYNHREIVENCSSKWISVRILQKKSDNLLSISQHEAIAIVRPMGFIEIFEVISHYLERPFKSKTTNPVRDQSRALQCRGSNRSFQ